jgi:choline dehydrogenase
MNSLLHIPHAFSHMLHLDRARAFLVSIQTKSDSKLENPDISINLFFADLRGMNDGWVDTISNSAGFFTWNVVTAPTTARTGNVTLTSTDPFAVPAIDFNGYEDEDLERSVVAIRMIRKMAKKFGLFFRDEVAPGHDVKTDEDIKAYIRAFAWGHHSIGTAKMGATDDVMAVVDGQFKVRGAQSLRVVDSSVLPSHPGFYVMIPLYMLAEKASDDIARDNVTISPASLGCAPP